MKIDKISFGQTYIKPSLVKYIKQEDLTNKVSYVYGLGELYPADIFLEANSKGGLTVDIMHSTPAKMLFFNDNIPKTYDNIVTLNFMHHMERFHRIHEGIKVPVLKTVINNIEKLSIKDLQLAVNDKIQYYYNTFGRKFLN